MMSVISNLCGLPQLQGISLGMFTNSPSFHALCYDYTIGNKGSQSLGGKLKGRKNIANISRHFDHGGDYLPQLWELLKRVALILAKINAFGGEIARF